MYRHFPQLKLGLNLLLACALLLIVPVTCHAAAVEWTAAGKKSFDKLLSGTDAKTAAALTKLYEDLLKTNQVLEQTDARLKAARKQNIEAESSLRKRIALIDQKKVDALQTQVNSAKTRYKPVMDSYTLTNKQLTAARKAKNKTLTALLQTQSEQLKIVVQLAKGDISRKEESLALAKSARTAKMKRLREMLTAIDKHEAGMKPEREAYTALNKQLSTLKKQLNDAVKEGGTAKVREGLTSLHRHVQTMLGHKQALQKLEDHIAAVISNTSAQVPAN